MANQKNFAIAPSVSIARSKFKRPSQHKTSFNLGEIVPIYVDADILPGDTISMNLASLVRMSTPIAPIMDNIVMDIYVFACPNRLLMTGWKSFMGENEDSAGVQTEPADMITDWLGAESVEITPGSIGDHMGLGAISDADLTVEVSRLPLNAYALIYNEWFRDQNLISPLFIDKETVVNGTTILHGEGDLSYADEPLKAAKFSDYFTRSLPYAQKGEPVRIPLSGMAPVVLTGIESSSTETIGSSSVDATFSDRFEVKAGETVDSTPLAGGFSGTDGVYEGMYAADNSKAINATINDLRFAYQYQKMLEKDALYGTRYWEILKGHFGVEAPDASLQRPELLGHTQFRINIDQVVQTTGINQASPSSNLLGETAGISVTGNNSSLFTKSFTEHSVLMILAVARHDQTYGQGVSRMWTRKKREDYYYPEFANLPAQKVLNKEIFVSDKADGLNDLVFGYQEAWAEYRYKPSVVSGLLNPSVDNSLGFYTLANNFAVLPTLSKSFIEQDRSSLARALSTGLNGPDFIADFYFDETAVRPMPMYSIPGLSDHH